MTSEDIYKQWFRETYPHHRMMETPLTWVSAIDFAKFYREKLNDGVIVFDKVVDQEGMKRIIMDTTVEWFGVSEDRITGPRSTSEVLDARCCVATLMTSLCFSQKEIGTFLGGRDPSTIHNTLKRADGYRKKPLYNKIRRVHSLINDKLTENYE